MDQIHGIDPTKSIILFWESTENEIIFKLDAFLLPVSVHYVKPPVEFFPCRRKGNLSFKNFESAGELKNIRTVKPDLGPHNRQDFGSFTEFQQLGTSCRLSGKFGTVEITGAEVCFTPD